MNRIAVYNKVHFRAQILMHLHIKYFPIEITLERNMYIGITNDISLACLQKNLILHRNQNLDQWLEKWLNANQVSK